ncbi:tonB-system energizer ExbB [Sphingomonas sp. VNH70]|uniref:tonB-system energizer ExbB n=1 Tax=Sphingomonas silueang TaxID=3156617 RepID=UPI0032B594AC
MRPIRMMFLLPLCLASLPGTALAVPTGAVQHDLTAWSMFLQADWLVRSVMLVLLSASVTTWGIAFAKYREFARARRAIAHDRRILAAARTLAAVPDLRSEIGSMLVATARDEVDGCVDLANAKSADAMTERLSVRLVDAEGDAVQSMRAGFSVLASVGATAPFVGLFGTVWGIMNSFIGISRAQTTNLAVVAPGIAEALLATALGLVAAIPAVLLYNIFSRQMAGFRRDLHHMSTRVACLVSHDAERAQVPQLKIAI